MCCRLVLEEDQTRRIKDCAANLSLCRITIQNNLEHRQRKQRQKQKQRERDFEESQSQSTFTTLTRPPQQSPDPPIGHWSPSQTTTTATKRNVSKISMVSRPQTAISTRIAGCCSSSTEGSEHSVYNTTKKCFFKLRFFSAWCDKKILGKSIF